MAGATPADIMTQPDRKIAFNAPLIGWAIKLAHPSAGVLDRVAHDRISFAQWTNAPEGAAKQFRREWFQGDGMVRRKNLPIEDNP